MAEDTSHAFREHRRVPRRLHAQLQALRDRLTERQREFQQHPERRQQILVDAFNELQNGLAGLAQLEEELTHEREEYEHGLKVLVQSEQKARADAESAAALTDEFIATISHELRTPLTAILGWTGILQRQYGDDSELLKAVTAIERSAQVQARLIEDLLDVSHMTLGRLRLDLKPLDVGTALAGAVNVIAPTATAKGVTVVAPPAGEVFIVLGDAMRLQQVFWNLLANAVKFTPAGGTVDVTIAGTESDVQVMVRDTGIGLTEEFLPHAFERFRRGDAGPSRRYSGLGLGLAIVRQLVEAHGGHVLAESGGPGQGAAFTVVLPLKRRHEERRTERRLPESAATEAMAEYDALAPPDESSR